MLKISSQLSGYFKGYCSSPEVIMLFVYMRGRFSLSYRDLEEMMSIRGGLIDHATLQRWVKSFSHLIDSRVRRRKKAVCSSWRMDETYVKLNGRWVYLYRAVDKYGETIDFLLRARRDKASAYAFFRKAFKQHFLPEKINIDKSGSNKSALKRLNKALPKDEQYEIRQVKYLNNMIEQDHRFIKKRIRPMLGFKNFYDAKENISLIENVRMIQKGQIIGQEKNQNAFINFVNLMA